MCLPDCTALCPMSDHVQVRRMPLFLQHSSPDTMNRHKISQVNHHVHACNSIQWTLSLRHTATLGPRSKLDLSGAQQAHSLNSTIHRRSTAALLALCVGWYYLLLAAVPSSADLIVRAAAAVPSSSQLNVGSTGRQLQAAAAAPAGTSDSATLVLQLE